MGRRYSGDTTLIFVVIRTMSARILASALTTKKLTGRDLRRRDPEGHENLFRKRIILCPPNPPCEGENISRNQNRHFLARPNAEEATIQLERALKKLGHTSYRIEDFLSLWMLLGLEWSQEVTT